MIERRSLLEWRPENLAAHLGKLGEPPYRARQVFDWALMRGATRFADMTDLPRSLRDTLAKELVIRCATEIRRSEAPDGTLKLLLAWRDGATTESVMIPAEGNRRRRTVCLSTQVGCDVGCRFCASGIGGSLRNLSVGEILEQAVTIDSVLAGRGERLTHVVFMGMGEPLANYRATVEAVRRINAPWSLGIAQRRITVSTVGLPRQIIRLADEGLQITLALSLHAARESLRRDLIPWATHAPLAELLAACRFYLEKTGREVTLEYCLLAGVNDRQEDVQELAHIARHIRAHVNLMMYNPVDSLPFKRPSRGGAIAFLAALRERGINAHLRESRGLEAAAACGQLRRSHVGRSRMRDDSTT
ncbi:MAG: 23S rRNA (adenine(2503)-C(2))-methyltransferase RlmN [Acidobacteriota bacterium]|nr:23S rRNA (adenine(2503)-C(2))-methyltransferase RlmN [Acidobacteriota bacterium]